MRGGPRALLPGLLLGLLVGAGPAQAQDGAGAAAAGDGFDLAAPPAPDGPVGAGGGTASNGAATAAAEGADEALRLVVVEAAPFGVDPIVGAHVTAQLRRTGAAMGYRVLSAAETGAAVARLRMPYPPTPADLWRLTYVAEAQRGAFARVWAQGGRYVVELVAASLDGTGPFYGRATAGAADLRQVVGQLAESTLPPPGRWSTTRTPPVGARPAPPPPTEEDRAAGASEASDAVTPRPAPRRTRRAPEPIGRRFQLVLQTEGAIGTSQDTFYNHLLGMRLDWRIARTLLLGAYVGYANLRGKAGRVGNLLAYLQIENRVRPSSRSSLTIPLRLAVGYLPFNGPVVRLAAGLNVPLSDRFELGFDLLTPTFWVLPDRVVVSLDLAAELIWRL